MEAKEAGSRRGRQYLERDIDFGKREVSLTIEVSPPEPVALVRETEETGGGGREGGRGDERGEVSRHRRRDANDDARRETNVGKQIG